MRDEQKYCEKIRHFAIYFLHDKNLQIIHVTNIKTLLEKNLQARRPRDFRVWQGTVEKRE